MRQPLPPAAALPAKCSRPRSRTRPRAPAKDMAACLRPKDADPATQTARAFCLGSKAAAQAPRAACLRPKASPYGRGG